MDRGHFHAMTLTQTFIGPLIHSHIFAFTLCAYALPTSLTRRPSALFDSVSLSFRTDRNTLQARFESQERGRDVARENVDQEINAISKIVLVSSEVAEVADPAINGAYAF